MILLNVNNIDNFITKLKPGIMINEKLMKDEES